MSTIADGGQASSNYRRVCVDAVLSTRYESGERPASWDDRVGGIDVVQVDGGETIRLYSTPMQSPPKPGWVLMLTGVGPGQGLLWTLYGMSREE
ncbi:MAG: hypothetical protein ACK5GN_05440 [Pseudomonadota bacterium]|jgi:hypothetical protein